VSEGDTLLMSATRKLHCRLRITGAENFAIGPGKIALLEAIATAGSISSAARNLGMSYRRAWLLIDDMNRAFKAPVVETATGGHQGGGSHLTPLGKEVVQRYRNIEAIAAKASDPEITALARLLARRAPE
jgi:molybdate transport system regulatory protein